MHRHTRPHLLTLTTALLVLAMPALFRVGVGDTFQQIASGRYFLAHGFPRTDPFTYLGAGHLYVEHAWLTCVLFAALYDSVGAWGLLAFKLGCLTATAWLLTCTAESRGVSPDAALLSALGAVLCLRQFTRPLLVSGVFTAAYLLILTRLDTGQWPPRCAWLLVLLHWLWAQCHGGHVVGLALLALWSGVCTWHWWQARPRQPWAATPLLVLLTCTLVGALGPYGLALLAYPIREAGQQAQLQVSEWAPLALLVYAAPASQRTLGLLALIWWAWGKAWGRPLRLAGLCLWVGVLGVGCVRSLSPPQLEPPDALYPVHTALLVAVLGVWLAGVWRRPGALLLTLPLALGFSLALRHGRALADVVPLTAAPLWAHLLGRLRHVQVVGTAAVLCLVALHLAWFRPTTPYAQVQTETQAGAGLGVDPGLACMFQFLRTHHLTGRLWTSAGSEVLVQRWPGLIPSQDARRHVAPAADQLLDRAAREGEPAPLTAYLERFHPDLVLQRHLSAGQALLPLLHARGWRLVLANDLYWLAVSPTSPYAHLPALQVLRAPPWPVAMAPRDAPRALGEAEYLLSACPGYATFVYAWQATALRFLGRTADEQVAARRIPARIDLE